MVILHLGCGRKGRASLPVGLGDQVLTLDADARLEPDLTCRLGLDPIPLPDNSVDDAVARHVLEHIGRQGDTAEWFFFFEDLYRVLKPGGRLEFEAPLYSSVWAWADPSHTRVLAPISFLFFDQDSYRVPNSSISPYRIACDFAGIQFEAMADSNPQIAQVEKQSHFRGLLQARKPLRPWWVEADRPTTSLSVVGQGV